MDGKRRKMHSKILIHALTHSELSRTLLAQAASATLSTLATEPAGYPFGSLVNFAVEAQGDIILLTSDLAEHSHNFKADDRASLLVCQRDAPDPVAAGRVTLVGAIEAIVEQALEQARALFLEANPSAKLYVDFKDFHFYRLSVKAVRYVGGFGHMSWVELDAYRQAGPDPIVPYAPGIISHMNEDHADAMLLMARHQAEVTGTRAVMSGVDRYGFDMNIETENGPVRVRLGFSSVLHSIEQVRPEMVAQVRRAREV